MQQSQDPGLAAVMVAFTFLACALGTAIGTCTVATVKAMDALDARAARKKREARRSWDLKRRRQQ